MSPTTQSSSITLPVVSTSTKPRSAGPRRWLIGAAVAVLFEISAVGTILGSQRPRWQVLAGLAGLVALTALYLCAIVARTWSMWARVVVLLAMVAVTVPLDVFLSPVGVLGLWTYVSLAGALMLPGPWALATAALLGAIGIGWSSAVGAGAPWETALTGVALTAWMVAFVTNFALNDELRRTRSALADAAVTAERERIARDLHDILGHSLTAVTVKAGLARRLLGRMPVGAGREAVETEVGDIERLAREALADIRATAAGYREVSLPGELAAAGAVLRAAGVTVEISTAASEVQSAARTVFGYVVREAVTNVVRHSRADRCTIELTADSVTVTNDGEARDSPFAGRGHGLTGLAARVAEAGGSCRLARCRAAGSGSGRVSTPPAVWRNHCPATNSTRLRQRDQGPDRR